MSVKFCPLCSNIFGYKVNKDTSKLMPVCSTCGHSETKIDNCLVINELTNRVQDYPLNHNTIFDTTLPRTRKIPCPNPSCPYIKKKSEGKEQKAADASVDHPEVIMFHYNPNMLKLGYMCVECRTYWKN